MKPPRPDRPRGAPSGAKPPHKPGRPHGTATGQATGGRSAQSERGDTRDASKNTGQRQPAGSYAGGAEKPRFGGGETGRTRFFGGKPQAPSARDAAEPARFRPRPAEARPAEARPAEARPAEARRDQARPLQTDRGFNRPPTQMQDRARESLARDREPRAPHAAQTPRGTVWLYGLHAVQAALANPVRRLRRLVLTEEGSAALTARLPAPWALTPETVDRARIDQLLGRDAVHQGAALLADLLPQPVLATALERPGPVLVLDQVTDPRNIGAILRSAAAFGVAAVIVQERHAPEETGSLAKAASGALESVPLLRAVNLARTIVMLKAANLWIVGLDAEATAALDGAAFKERRVALVLGGEGSGLRRLTRESCDELAKLPMAGIMESLNVSAAAAVALYELGRPSLG
jgi:23S rRNA (guanosine2251-2'-O)-methyltransferase